MSTQKITILVLVAFASGWFIKSHLVGMAADKAANSGPGEEETED